MSQKEKKREIIKQYARKSNDTGSAEVQIALLSERIHYLTTHASTRKNDHSSRRGLLGLVGQRRRLLSYLKDENQERYQKVIDSLGLRK